MSKTNNAGIDYGMGTTNVDTDNGIRYGVIVAHEVGQAWYDEAESEYGEPHCPKCGNEATDNSIDTDDYEGGDFDDNEWETLHHACGDYSCESCKVLFDADDAFGDTPQSFRVSNEDFLAIQGGDDSDIMVLKSPYYTRCQFCSPCAPGAGYLTNTCEDGPKAYCFGPDWFMDGECPYPVYRVDNDECIYQPAE